MAQLIDKYINVQNLMQFVLTYLHPRPILEETLFYRERFMRKLDQQGWCQTLDFADSLKI